MSKETVKLGSNFREMLDLKYQNSCPVCGSPAWVEDEDTENQILHCEGFCEDKPAVVLVAGLAPLTDLLKVYGNQVLTLDKFKVNTGIIKEFEEVPGV